MNITPNTLARKASPKPPAHEVQLLGGLIEARPETSTYKSIHPDDLAENGAPAERVKNPRVTKTKRVRQNLRYPLAQNVSEDSVERLARRWKR